MAELERFFFLDDVDRALVAKRRGAHSRLGFAVQLTTVRFLGVFLEDPVDVPWPVVEFLAGQLDVADPSVVKRYTQRPKTPYEHAWEIRDEFGFRPFDDVGATGEFGTFLAASAWTHVEGPGVLFDAGVVWLREHLVLLPGITTLTRLVAGARDMAAERTYQLLSDIAATRDGLCERLVGSLLVTESARVSVLERWRRPSLRVSGPGMVAALGRAANWDGSVSVIWTARGYRRIGLLRWPGTG